MLVQYFTVLGFDTGYTVEEAMARVDPISRGGLEHSLGRGNLAYVSKSPWYGNRLGEWLEGDELAVRWMILPLRELHAAAESRREASRRAEEAGRDPHAQPGGLSFGAKGKPKQQEQRLGVQLYRLVHTLAHYGVPTVLLPFPEFARDHDVLLHRLGPLLEEHGVSPTSRWRPTSGSSTPATSPTTPTLTGGRGGRMERGGGRGVSREGGRVLEREGRGLTRSCSRTRAGRSRTGRPPAASSRA